MSDKYEIRDQITSGLKSRVTFLFFFFFISIFAVFIITSVMQVNTVVRFLGSQMAIPTVRLAQGIIDGDAFEALSKSVDKNDPSYETMRLRLLELREKSSCKFLYSMSRVNEKMYRFIIDGSDLPGGKDFSPLGTEEDVSEYESAFFKAMESGEIMLGSIEQSETWGRLISAYAPVRNSKGSVVGVIGCDLDASEVVSWIRQQVLWQAGMIAVFIVVGLAVYLVLLQRIDRIYQQET
jgi:methyl-accepting chemotaxis protein